MRSERLLNLIFRISDGKVHSAPELARGFGVSERSIYRDLDLLSSLGYPLEAIPGREGGYRALPGYSVDRSLLKEGELAAVQAALSGIGSATGEEAVLDAGRKLAALIKAGNAPRQSWLRVELGGFEGDRRMIEVLKAAIKNSQLVDLAYRDQDGRSSERSVEPVAVVYLWQSWYLWAYCRLREDFRLFKLRRIEKAQTRMATFAPRPEPSPTAWKDQWEGSPASLVELEVQPEAVAKASECFGPVQDLPGGRLGIKVSLPVGEWLVGFILAFGPGIKVLAPESLARTLRERIEALAQSYRS